MYICPLCNGFETADFHCVTCGQQLMDGGRVIDYFDDYSAYMEIDGMKQIDGFATTLSEHKCAHLFYCENCSLSEIKLIQE
ncbi:hypothetical protein [Litchfieldia salsa]|uniref:Uncharacterized protein n=1 Tax=Litchfieldia salsa TaxID=930152 RepID=A0A1H0UY29_9BACI|nr:hypothetical protein [Litchfieldia salsa]SDP70808.1 hypothetical protein SAMN05216565_105230 [Litchfieldia salsa]